MVNEDDIQAALVDLDTQSQPDYSAAAKKYSLYRTTLLRRHRGVTRSRDTFLSETTRYLTNEQEAVLIKHINRITDRGMPPTAQIVRNLAEEMRGKRVSKNWTSDFVRRFKQKLKSLYLFNIDNLRVKAEYGPMY